jgi:rubredoxin
MSDFRYSLEKYSGMKSRFICPHCGKRELVRYIDLEMGNYVDENVGKCNRIENCGYHFTPKMFFEKNGIFRTYFTEKRIEIIEKET